MQGARGQPVPPGRRPRYGELYCMRTALHVPPQFREDPDAEDPEEEEEAKPQREKRHKRRAGSDEEEGGSDEEGREAALLQQQQAKKVDKLRAMDPKELTYEFINKKLREIVMSRCVRAVPGVRGSGLEVDVKVFRGPRARTMETQPEVHGRRARAAAVGAPTSASAGSAVSVSGHCSRTPCKKTRRTVC